MSRRGAIAPVAADVIPTIGAAAPTRVLDRLRAGRTFDAMTEPSPVAVLDGVFASSGVGLCLVDPDGRIRRVNAAWLESVQLRAEDVLGHPIAEVFPEAPPQVVALLERARRGAPVDVPPHRQVVAGREVWYAARVSPVAYPGGTGLLVTAWDVTAAKRAELAIAEEHARLRRHVASTPLALVEWDGGYRVIGYSERAQELFGFPPAEVLGRRIDEIPWVPEEDWPSVRAVMRDMWTATRATNVNANRNVRRDGKIIHCEWYNSALHDASGKLVSMLSFVLDVTARQEAIEALRASEARARAVEEDLRAANERLLEADHRKDDFLAMLSHELRNPLAAIRHAATILADERAEHGQVARGRAVISRQVEHMTRLVDDLLDVTRIARGKIELRRAPVELGAVVRRAADDHAPLLAERGLALALDVPGAPVWVDGDATRLSQVVGNLLQNAAKFTPRGGRVTVALGADGGGAELRVADTGAGIPPELLARVFEPFVQGDQSLARTQGGLGLGLAVVRAVVALHGGEVRAESPRPGEGATFVVRLPTVAAAAATPAAVVAATPARRRILVVDDNQDAAESLADVLRLAGHEVEVAFDGPGALARIRADAPDVVLCDIGLPGMTGYEVARRVRALRGQGVKLLALSGYARPEDVARAREAGFDAHVAKPFDPRRLATLLAT